MKFFILITATILTLISLLSSAQDHTGHTKHNMVLFGESQIFASHIVYKVPHNYQVILELKLDPMALQEYLKTKSENPSHQFIFLLDPMDISEIKNLDSISGSILHEDTSGQRSSVVPKVTIAKNNFKIIFFDELPLSLSADAKKITTGYWENCQKIKCQ